MAVPKMKGWHGGKRLPLDMMYQAIHVHEASIAAVACVTFTPAFIHADATPNQVSGPNLTAAL
jgi:hypothetical protein